MLRIPSLLVLLLLLVLCACEPEAAPAAGDHGDASADASGGPEGTTEGLLLRERNIGVMGTTLQVTVLGTDETRLEAALDAAVAELERVEDTFTTWRDSPLQQLNQQAGSGPQPAPPEVLRLIDRALEIGRLTHGAFEVTFWPLGKIWDYKADPPRVPSRAEIAEARKLVDYRRIEVDREAGTVTIPAGMSVGLGGIAKGYGVDRAMQVLLESGIEHGMVNAGGDLKALGRKHGKPWEIAIKHPRDRERIIAVLPVSNVAVVTSGDYERFFEYEGKRYHHIIDPRTGRPSQGCMSATVMAPDAALADALATAMCVLGPEEGLPIIEGLGRVEALLVDMEGGVQRSSGLRKHE